MRLGFLLCIFLFLIAISVKGEEDIDDKAHRLLRKKLFASYNKYDFSGKNHKTAVEVKLGFSLIQIVGLDTFKHVLTTEAWLKLTWYDHHLRWEPNDYNGVDILRVPADEVFVPDVVLYNAAGEHLREEKANTNVLIYPSGTVLWVPPVVSKSICPPDLYDYPFDTQKCFLKFGSWTHDGLKLNLTLSDTVVDMTDYWVNPEWQILSHIASREEKYYPCCAEPYPSVKFELTMKRRSTPYHYLMVIPSTVATVALLLIFWLPATATSNRFYLATFAIIVYLALLLQLAFKLHISSGNGIPKFVKYLSWSVLYAGITLIWSTVAYNLATTRRHFPRLCDRLLQQEVFSRIWCCPNSPVDDNLEIQFSHAEMEIEGSIFTSPQMISQKRKHNSAEWTALVALLDKVLFVIYLLIMLGLHL